MFKSGLVLSSGNIATALLTLARNVIIARLISVEDFGIASTLAITWALVEMASNLALNRLVVQARDGEAPGLLSTLHSLQVARGVLGAAILFATAIPVARLFGVPEIAWVYQAMAVLPLLRGLAHLDMFRRQREMQFLPTVTVEATAQLIATAAAFPLALWLADYRAMFYALLVQQLAFTAMSHGVAVRPYRWGWDKDVIWRALHFGWPLLLNGLLIFGILYGERVIVGSLIGLTELGWFSVAFSLTFMAAMVSASTLNTFFLPQLARAQDDAVRFHARFLVAMQASLLLGLALAVGFALVGPTLLILLYGAKYAPALSILVWLAVMQGVRMARIGAAVTATSKANTVNPLLGNIVRILALPVAWVVVSMGGDILTLVLIGIAAEVVSFLVSILLLRRRFDLALDHLVLPFAASGAAFLVIAIDALDVVPNYLPGQMQALIVAAALVALLSMHELREWVTGSLWKRGLGR